MIAKIFCTRKIKFCSPIGREQFTGRQFNTDCGERKKTKKLTVKE